MSVTADVEQFIISELSQGRDITTIDPGDNLLAKGIVDSHGVMELVAFLEERFGIRIQAHEVSVDYLNTLDDIARLVASKSR